MNIYVVKPGDTVWLISKKYGVDYQSIIDTNDLPKSGVLVNGQTLIIPSKEKTYKVNKGDTIWAIGKTFGVSKESIIEFNKLQDGKIYEGLVLRIPEKKKIWIY